MTENNVKYIRVKYQDTQQLSDPFLLEVLAENTVFKDGETLEEKMPKKAEKSIYGDTCINLGRIDGEATGLNSVAIGNEVIAAADNTLAAGYQTIATGKDQTVIGHYNLADDNNIFAFIIGNGNEEQRSNAFAVEWDGTIRGKRFTNIDGSELNASLEQIIVTKKVVDETTGEETLVDIPFSTANSNLKLLPGDNINFEAKSVLSEDNRNIIELTISSTGSGGGGGSIEGDYLPLKGGTLTGPLFIDLNEEGRKVADGNYLFLTDSENGEELLINPNKIQYGSSSTYSLFTINPVDSRVGISIGNKIYIHSSVHSITTEKTLKAGGSYSIVWGRNNTNSGSSYSAIFGADNNNDDSQASLIVGSSNSNLGHSNIIVGRANTLEGSFSSTFGELLYNYGDYSSIQGGGESLYNYDPTVTNEELYLEWNENKNFALIRGRYAHAEGYNILNLGNYSHNEGLETVAIGDTSHAEGYGSVSRGFASHTEGVMNEAEGEANHVEGYQNVSKKHFNHISGYQNIGDGFHLFVNGVQNKVISNYSSVIGKDNYVLGDLSFIFGNTNNIIESNNTVLGNSNTLLNLSNYVIGDLNTLNSINSFVIGKENTGNSYSLILGTKNIDNGYYNTIIGTESKVGLTNNFLIGRGLLGNFEDSIILGKYNKPIDALFIIGNGTDDENRKNILYINKDEVICVNTALKFGDNVEIGSDYIHAKSIAAENYQGTNMNVDNLTVANDFTSLKNTNIMSVLNLAHNAGLKSFKNTEEYGIIVNAKIIDFDEINSLKGNLDSIKSKDINTETLVGNQLDIKENASIKNITTEKIVTKNIESETGTINKATINNISSNEIKASSVKTSQIDSQTIIADEFKMRDGSPIGGNQDIPLGTIITNQNPDSSGYEEGSWICLGHQTLSIFDNAENPKEVLVYYWKRVKGPKDEKYYIKGTEIETSETFSIVSTEISETETFSIKQEEEI